jgi:hypothetical protein
MPGGAALLGKLLRPVCRAPEEALQALVSVVQNNGRGRLHLRSLDPGDRLVLQILPATAIIEEPRAAPTARLGPLDRSKHIGIPHYTPARLFHTGFLAFARFALDRPAPAA